MQSWGDRFCFKAILRGIILVIAFFCVLMPQKSHGLSVGKAGSQSKGMELVSLFHLDLQKRDLCGAFPYGTFVCLCLSCTHSAPLPQPLNAQR